VTGHSLTKCHTPVKNQESECSQDGHQSDKDVLQQTIVVGEGYGCCLATRFQGVAYFFS